MAERASENLDSHVTLWSKRFGLVIFGWLLSSAYHDNLHLDQDAKTLQVVERAQIPALTAQAHCEHTRADKTAAVAGKAIIGANVDNAPIPQFRDIPTDNCPHPAGK